MRLQAKYALLTASALGATCGAPVFAQAAKEQDNAASGNDIVVTAQRVEQRLQDVPISITVFDQATLTRNNVQSAKDIATYTPGLTTLNRNGENSTSFAIRGFVQERGTTGTVGTYFADVVAPRGSGGTTGGDGAGPGALFDLQNVQVLKGPQGTLFGRNSTGGAVLLVPRKPTDRLEGYIEGSLGSYDLRRVEAVLNVPLAETLRTRLGVDRNMRDGYQKNIGNLGNGPHGTDMANRDYWALRASAVWDVTPDLESYFLASYTRSNSSGNAPRTFYCTYNQTINGVTKPVIVDPVTRLPINGSGSAGLAPIVAFGVIPSSDMGCKQIVRQSASPWTVENSVPTAKSDIRTWQILNTTTWTVSDNLTIKNIISYAEFRQREDVDFFGLYFPIGGRIVGGLQVGGLTADQVTGPGQITSLAPAISDTETGYNNAQSTFVEELQFQGQTSNGRLTWQAGLYYESSKPLGPSGTLGPSFTPCTDLAAGLCMRTTIGSSLGAASMSRYENSYRSLAAYAQASYELTDTLKFTAGIRYTDDHTSDTFRIVTLGFPVTDNAAAATARCTNAAAPGFGIIYTYAQRFDICQQHIENTTNAPTWLLNLDFKPIENVLLYAKWSRGYRQGGVFVSSPNTLQKFGAEKLDTYEIGGKTSWRGAVPGSFNISGYYNDFRNQQLQVGVDCIPTKTPTCTGTNQTTTVANVGKSRLYGLEAELVVSPFEGFRVQAAYAYLNSKLKSFVNVDLTGNTLYNNTRPILLGDPIPNALPHKLTIAAEYTLPLPESIGRISVGGTFVYQSRYRTSADAVVGTGFGILPSASFGNINANWENVGGMPVDLAFFMTNVTNKVVYLHVNDNSARGTISYSVAEPRMWGFRLKYRFGH